MIELAEDEQDIFIERIKNRSLRGKKKSEYPTFTALIGAPGSGKSTFARRNLKNSAIISVDDVLTEYAKTLGIDMRSEFNDQETVRFAGEVCNAVILAAIDKKLDIVYDTANPVNSCKMMEYMEKRGYSVEAKVLLADEYQAALNATERKLDFDEKYMRYKQGMSGHPRGNPLDVSPQCSLNISGGVVQFIEQARKQGITFEIYEFGKDTPSFRNGDNFDNFVENAQVVPTEQNIERCEKLVRRAEKSGKEDGVLNLLALKKEMIERR